MLVPVAPHALLKDICLHNEVWKGSVTADGQCQGPQRLLLLAGGASRAQQQPCHWAASLLPCHHCFLILWQCWHQTPAALSVPHVTDYAQRSFMLVGHMLAEAGCASSCINKGQAQLSKTCHTRKRQSCVICYPCCVLSQYGRHNRNGSAALRTRSSCRRKHRCLLGLTCNIGNAMTIIAAFVLKPSTLHTILLLGSSLGVHVQLQHETTGWSKLAAATAHCTAGDKQSAWLI